MSAHRIRRMSRLYRVKRPRPGDLIEIPATSTQYQVLRVDPNGLWVRHPGGYGPAVWLTGHKWRLYRRSKPRE